MDAFLQKVTGWNAVRSLVQISKNGCSFNLVSGLSHNELRKIRFCESPDSNQLHPQTRTWQGI